jgi:hypothetical protein
MKVIQDGLDDGRETGPGHRQVGASQAAEKLIPAGILEGFVTGHDFSRAANAIESMQALAP